MRSRGWRKRVRLQKLPSPTARRVRERSPAASAAWRSSCSEATLLRERLCTLTACWYCWISATEARLPGFLIAGTSRKRTGSERGGTSGLVRYRGTSSEKCRKRNPHIRLKRNLGDRGSR